MKLVESVDVGGVRGTPTSRCSPPSAASPDATSTAPDGDPNGDVMHAVQTAGNHVSAHHQPATLDEALALLDDHGRLGPSGRRGTDLLLELQRGARPGSSSST